MDSALKPLRPGTNGMKGLQLDGCADEIDSALKPLRPGTNGMKGLQLDGCADEMDSALKPLRPGTNGMKGLQLDGCADEMDSALKPLRPGTNGMKGLQLDGRFVSAADGSLPSTPDSQELGSAELDRDTRQLLLVFYRTHTGLCSAEKSHSGALPTMRRVVADILEKHQIVYKGMLQRLQLDSQPDSMDFLHCIAQTMFKDGSTNWGRVTSLVAFGAVVCSRLKEARRERCVEAVAEQISSYLTSEQHDWLLHNNGWDGFVEFFREQDVESVVRNTLMAGIGD